MSPKDGRQGFNYIEAILKDKEFLRVKENINIDRQKMIERKSKINGSTDLHKVLTVDY